MTPDESRAAPGPWRRGLPLLGGLALFHLAASIALSLAARATLAGSPPGDLGLWDFAPDSFSYHTEAVRLTGLLGEGDFVAWWGSCRWWHVKWIALSYAVLGADPLAFAPVNAVTWALSVVCVLGTARALFPGRARVAAACALVFGLLPSHFLHTTQLLKDSLYVLGVALLFWGCVLTLLRRPPLLSAVPIVGGLTIAYLNRAYALEPLLALALLAVVLGAGRDRARWRGAGVAIALLVGLGAVGGARRPAIRIRPPPGPVAATPSLPPVEPAQLGPVDRTVAEIAVLRDLFTNKYPGAGSNLDADVRFTSTGSVLAHVPRATVVGFLAPFPSHWFDAARTAGPFSRGLAGAEMTCWYALLLGFAWFVATGPAVLRARLWMLAFTVALVVPTGLVVTNVGALYRLRFVYLLPVLIGGLEVAARRCTGPSQPAQAA